MTEGIFNPVISEVGIGQTVAVGAWLPIVVLVVLLLVIVALAYRGMQKNPRRPLIRPRTPAPTLSDRNEELKRNLAEMQARNAAEIARTRAILEEARTSGSQVVRETTEGVVQATREETQRARAEIVKAREEHLAELRREGASIGQDEPPAGTSSATGQDQ
jgi:hypothetical protein